jgi:hypothetical protein
MFPDNVLIALAHSIPILATRLFTNSKVTLVAVAAVMAVIAVQIGESQSTIPNLIVVGVAWYFCNKSIRSSTATSPTMFAESPTQKITSDLDLIISGIIIVAVVGLVYFYFFDKPKTSTPNTPIGESNPKPFSKPNPDLTKKHDSSSSTRQPAPKPSLSARLRTVASEMNSGAPKSFGDHLTLLNAVANGSSLSISIRINNYTASNADAQTPFANSKGSITHYYCGLESYRQLISEGATFIIQLYGKDRGSIGTYPVTELICRT